MVLTAETPVDHAELDAIPVRRDPLALVAAHTWSAVSTAFWVTRRDAQNVPTVAALTRLAVEMASTDRGVAQTP